MSEKSGLKCNKVHFQTKTHGEKEKEKVVSFHHNVVFMCKKLTSQAALVSSVAFYLAWKECIDNKVNKTTHFNFVSDYLNQEIYDLDCASDV